jgi:hypothetical protein
MISKIANAGIVGIVCSEERAERDDFTMKNQLCTFIKVLKRLVYLWICTSDDSLR